MTIKECAICGLEFKALTLGQKYCSDCNTGLYKSINNEEKEKPRTNPNQRLIDEVREAAKQGLSYGKYKGRGI